MAIKILIVDDDPANLNVLKKLCQKEGWQVDTAGNGGDAFRQIEKQKPDLVLLDIMLPDILGTDLCLKIRREKRFDAMRIVLITGKKIEFIDQKIGHSMGADAYFSRPSSAGELMNSIRSIMAGDSTGKGVFTGWPEAEFDPGKTTFTASAFQQVSLKEAYPDEFAALSLKFSELVRMAMEERIYKSENTASLKTKELSRELGFMKANALDVVQVFNASLKHAAGEESAERFYYLKEESRIILLELMGYLLNYYRNLSTL